MTAFIGELRLFPYDLRPSTAGSWAVCDGSLLPIALNPALFSVIGTLYGGDGMMTFALPDLRGRVPLGQGFDGEEGYAVGQSGGTDTVLLSEPQLPEHTHAWAATGGAATSGLPSPQVALAGEAGAPAYLPPSDGQVALSAAASSPYGHMGAHNNLQPYLAMNWCIALEGVYPVRP